MAPLRRTSTQEVLPPYRKFSGWGVGVEPRTPQNFICILPLYSRAARNARAAGTIAAHSKAAERRRSGSYALFNRPDLVRKYKTPLRKAKGNSPSLMRRSKWGG